MVKAKTRNWVVIVLILIALYLVSSLLANIVSMVNPVEQIVPTKGNVAIIPLKGIITTEGEAGFGTSAVSSTDFVALIEKAKKDEKIKAVIFEINSPGGSAVASEEIELAVKKLNKTSVAWIREVGASGAYWVASATDHIVASRMSATGSIGVITSYLEFAGLMERYNVTYQRLVAGKYKDMGTPFKELTNEERKIIEQRLEKVHDYFIQTVAENRNLSEEKAREFSTGMVFLGSEALENGLIDEIGGKAEAIAFIEKELNITVSIVTYEKQKSIVDILSELTSNHGYYAGVGVNDALVVKT